MLYQSGTFLLLLILVMAMGEDNYLFALFSLLIFYFIYPHFCFYWCILIDLLIVESILKSFRFLKMQGFLVYR